MRILKFAGLAFLLSLLACGSGSRNGDGGSDNQKESESVQALILKYQIEVSNIPLVGPQSEEVDLAISDEAVKYEGLVSLPVADEISKIRHSSILDFADSSQTFLKPADSTYSVEFYKLTATERTPADREESSGSGSGYIISLTATDKSEDIGQLSQCHKFNIRSKGSLNISKTDSIPSIKGEIWVYGGDDVKDLIMNYYRMQSKFLGDSSFEGLELWGVLGRLGIPRTGIMGLLDQLDGLLAKADLNIELYSLGKKANVSVKADIAEFERKRLPGNYFEAPAQYKPIFGEEKKDGSLPAAQ